MLAAQLLEAGAAGGGARREYKDLIILAHSVSWKRLALAAQQLAGAMGVSRSALYKWLNGSSQMRSEKFERLQALKAMAGRWQEARLGGSSSRRWSLSSRSRMPSKCCSSRARSRVPTLA